MVQEAAVFAVDLQGVDLGVITFAVTEDATGRKGVAGGGRDISHIPETAEMTIKTEDDRVKKEAFVAGIVDNVDVGVLGIEGGHGHSLA